MSVSLYRKYRPQTFAELVGQPSAASVLTKSISRGKVGHAYLFSGSRGCGKTSAARIFAKALNCLQRENFEPCGKCRNCTEITAGESLDVVEIDGASNNGVDNIRSLKENVTLAPFNSPHKIYIIDEVHMLSQGAFNALLKTLEEPPGHVIFIMATTEPHKVPVTIRSRCQHIPFRSIMPEDIFARLEFVCVKEGISFEADALREISRQSDGALRDALSLLEQVSASGDVTLPNVEAVLGAGSRSTFERWITSFRSDRRKAFTDLRGVLDVSSSVRVFEEIFTLIRDLFFAAKWRNTDGLNLSEPEIRFLNDEAKHWDIRDIHRLMKAVMRVMTQARLGVRKDILIGTLMADTEIPPVSLLPSAQPVTQPKPAAHTAVQNTPAPETPGLKEKLLLSAHDFSFLMWCAMFDVAPCLRGEDLVLTPGHKYVFHILKNSRSAAMLFQTLEGYRDIILSYDGAEFVCPRISQTERTAPTVIPSIQAIPAAHTALTEAPPAAVPAKPASAVSEILMGLAGMGLNPQIIQRFKTDTSTDTDITEDSDNDA